MKPPDQNGRAPQVRFAKARVWAMLGYVTLFGLACLVYGSSGFTDVWGYYGFRNDPDAARLWFAFGLVFTCGLLLPLTARLSSVALHLALVSVVLPTLVLYACAGASQNLLRVTLFGFGAIWLAALVVQLLRIPVFSLARMRLAHLLAVLLLVVVVSLGSNGYLTSLRNFNLNFWRVYEFREAIVQELPHIFGYLNSWTGNVLAPAITVIGLHRRRIGWALTGPVLGLLAFAFTAHKTPLVFPWLAAAAYVAGNKYSVRPVPVILTAFALMWLGLIISYRDFAHAKTDSPGETGIGNLVFRRVFMTPALLNGFYVETFGRDEPFWRFADKSFTLNLVERPASLHPPYLIGERYFQDDAIGANTGWIGSGYAQWGLAGVILYAWLFVGFCAIGDALIRRSGFALPLSILLVPMVLIVTTSDFFTVMLSHGGILALLITLALPTRPAGPVTPGVT